MKKHWIYYIVGVLIACIALIFEERMFFLLLVLFELMAPFLVWMLLKREAKYMTVTFLHDSARSRGQKLDVVIRVANRRKQMVSGAIKVNVRIENVLYGDVRNEELLIPLTNVQDYVFTRTLFECGEKKLTYEKVVLYDVFGLGNVRLKCPEEQMITVYPQSKEVNLYLDSVSRGWNDEGKNADSKMGKDMSEIFDIREYQPGDDIRRIHHKLSSKVAKLMVRQGSDIIDSDTIILFDAGLTNQDKNGKLKNALIEMASSVSEALIKQGISHYAALATANGLSMFLIDSEEKRLEMITAWMNIHMYEETGKALKLYRMINYDIFSRFIYVTHGNLQEKNLIFDDKTEVVAICLNENEEQEFQVIEHKNYKVMQISVGMVEHGEMNLYI